MPCARFVNMGLVEDAESPAPSFQERLRTYNYTPLDFSMPQSPFLSFTWRPKAILMGESRKNRLLLP